MLNKKKRKKDEKPSSIPAKSKISPELISALDAEGYLDSLNLTEIKHLLSQDTYDAHKKAYALLQEYGLTAFQRWEKIHADPSLKHYFSKNSADLVNDFAHMVLIYLKNDSKILELGSGYGNDALFIAGQIGGYVTAVDASSTAIDEAKKQAEKEDLKIEFISEDYLKTLAQMKGVNLDMVYCHSAAHYWPARLFEDSILSAIADSLDPSGVFCLVMKTAHSASAHPKNQIHLNSDSSKEEPYLYTLDKKDRMFVMYPKTKEILFKALGKYFEIAYEEVVEVEGYDKVGEVEVFACVIARPKKS